MSRKDRLPSERSRRAPNASFRWSRRVDHPDFSPDSERLTDGNAPPESRSVLLVDEDEFARDTLALILRTDGYRVRKCATIAEAQKNLAASKPALIVAGLLDRGPEWSAFLCRMRRKPLFRDIPVIVVSAVGGRVGRGVQHFTKPIDVDELRAAIRERLSP